jgi:hypothetical protein
MKYVELEDPIAEVHRVRAALLKKYGGIEGWHKHNIEDQPHLEKEGWRFATPEEIDALRRRHADAELVASNR